MSDRAVLTYLINTKKIKMASLNCRNGGHLVGR